MLFWQYLKRVFPRAHNILERFALLLCIGLIWAFAAILTESGAYNNAKEQTKQSCRTDRTFLISSAPWYVQISGLSTCVTKLINSFQKNFPFPDTLLILLLHMKG